MRPPRRLPASALADLRAPFPADTTATCSAPGVFPAALAVAGIRPRDPARNGLLGTTVSRPNAEDLVVGVAYVDAHDGLTDEDLFFCDARAGTVRHFPRGAYERANPAFRGTHRGD